MTTSATQHTRNGHAFPGVQDAYELAACIAKRCRKFGLHGETWRCLCPAHDDHKPSLYITPAPQPAPGHVLIKCHPGCTTESVVAALRLTMADLFVCPKPSAPSTGHKRVAKTYDYRDANGNLMHQSVRYEPKDFRQRRPDPANPEQFIWGLGDIEPVLYHLADVLTAVQQGQKVYLVKEEKDADALTALGLAATCNPMGAGKWRDSYTATLSGADVVILPDNDEPGRKHAEKVAAALQGHAKRVRVVNLPGLSNKGDVSDWLNAGGTREQLEALTEASKAAEPERKPLSASMVSFAGLMQMQMPERALYMDWLQERSIVMVYGPRGVGKTMQLLALSISLATGKPFLKWTVHQSVGVLYVDGEMALNDLRARVMALTAGSIPERLAFLPSELVYQNSSRDLTLTSDLDRREIEAILDAHPDIRVLVLDNISCLFSGISEDKKQDWEPINAWFVRLRHRGITVIAGHHAGKGGKQRGTSSREDSLDTTIALTYPDGHKAEDGCHFHLVFERSRGASGRAVEALDVRLEDIPGEGPTWTWSTLEESRTARITAMLSDGVAVRDIAEELGVSKSYVHRIKKKVG
jgi:hypothetical protein